MENNIINLNALKAFHLYINEETRKRIRTYYFVSTRQQMNNLFIEIDIALKKKLNELFRVRPYEEWVKIADDADSLKDHVQVIKWTIDEILEAASTDVQKAIDMTNNELLPKLYPSIKENDNGYIEIMADISPDGTLLTADIPNVSEVISVVQYTEPVYDDKLEQIRDILNK